MDEEFESFVVTDPDIVDPGIDVSGLRTQTDVSPYLLGNIPDYAGIQYEAFNPNRLSDLMRLYSSGLPAIDTTAAAAPPATGGGGSGDGGQGTDPVEIENQRLIDEGIGIQAEPGGPVFAPGEEPVTQDQIDAFNQIPVNTDYTIGSIDPVDDAIATTGLLPGIEFDPDTGTYDEANLIEGNQYTDLPVDEGGPPSILNPATYADTRDPADLASAGGVTAGIEDLGYATDFYGDPNEDLIERGAVPEEGGITDRSRGQIPTTDKFDVTTDQFTRPTIADVAGPGDFKGAPIQTEDLQTIDGEPIGYLGTLDTPPNIVMAKDPEGVVDPFDGKYTMSTAITPEDTEKTIKGKVADFLGVTEDQVNMAAVTGALNVVGGKILETNVPIASLVTQGVPLVKKGIDKVVDIITGGDDKDTTPTTGVNPFADIDTGVGEFDTTPAPTGGGADIPDRGRGTVSTAGQAGPPSQRGGGADIPDRGRGTVSTAGQAGPPSQRGGGGGGGGGGDGGGGGGGGGCVIATHAVNSGAFTKDTKREAVRWCVKNLHRTWWGEAIRRGYRYYGQKAIEEGRAKNHYQEFKDYVAFGTGKRRTLKTGWTFVYRSIQFFIRGLING